MKPKTYIRHVNQEFPIDLYIPQPKEPCVHNRYLGGIKEGGYNLP